MLVVVDKDDLVIGVNCVVCCVFGLEKEGVLCLCFVLDLFGCDDEVMGFECVECVVVIWVLVWVEGNVLVVVCVLGVGCVMLYWWM